MGLFKKNAVGLDISDRSIEAIFIVKRAGSVELKSYGRVVIPAGIVVNGYVERRNDLIQMIRKLLADGMTPPLPKGSKRIVLSLPESRVFGHVFQVPRIADISELEKTLEFEADAFFPYGHEDMIGVMAETAKKPDTKDIYYSAVHKETLKSYLNMFHQAGLPLVAIEAESSSIARALLQPDERSPVAIVDIGARVTDLTIVDRNGPQFSETLNIAGDVFTGVLTEHLNIPFNEAEELKKENGITGKMSPDIEDGIKKELTKLAGDINQAIAYFEKRSGRVIEKVMLAGGSSLMPGLMPYLEEQLVTPEKDIDVMLGDPWFGLKMMQSDAQESISNRGILMATAIGLGLRGAGVKKFPDVNFLDNAHDLIGQVTEKKSKKKGKGLTSLPPWLLALVGFLFFISTALGTWYLSFRFYVENELPPSAAVVGDEPITADAVSIEAKLLLGDTFSIEKNLVRATKIEVSKNVGRTFVHAGIETEGRSGGDIEIINDSSSGQTLVATTRFLSEKGTLFRLADRVFVPAGGRVVVRIEADAVSKDGDIDPSRFTIPGLSASAQQVIYGESSVKMTGGITFEGASLTAEEFDAAKLELSTEAGAALFEVAIEKAGDEFILKEGLFHVLGSEVVRGPSVGEPTGDYELEVRVSGTVLAISEEELETILKAVLFAEYSDFSETARIGRITIEVLEYREEEGVADILVTAIALP